MSPSNRAVDARTEIGLLDVLRAPARDVAAAVSFYRDVLGGVVRAASSESATIRLADVDLAIRGGAEAAPRAAGWEPTFRVRDLGALRARLVDAGARITRDLHDVPGGVVLAFTDIDGNPLAACQYGVRVADVMRAEPDG